MRSLLNLIALLTMATVMVQPQTSFNSWATRPTYGVANKIYALESCQVWIVNDTTTLLYVMNVRMETNDGTIDHVIILTKNANGGFDDEHFWRTFYDDAKIRSEINPSLKTDVFWDRCGGKMQYLPNEALASFKDVIYGSHRLSQLTQQAKK